MDAFSDERFIEMLLWGMGFFLVLIGLFILSRLLKYQIGNKVKESALPFGMSAEDLEKFRQDGGLTEEEMKAIRRTMAQKIVERARAEERARRAPSRAEAAFQQIEEKLRQQGVKALQDEDDSPAPAASAPPRPPVVPRPQAPAPPPPQRLPAHLEPLLGKTDFELDELVSAGFLTAADAALLRSARPEA